MSTRGVIFFNAGTKHNVHAAVAVASLRDHYQGPVALITEEAGPGREACELIASDPRNHPIEVIPDRTARSGRNGVSYQSKTNLPLLSPFDATIFLDADVVVVGDLSPLWPDESTGEVVLTQFSDWVSTGAKMRQRIKPWGEVIVDGDGEQVYFPDQQQIDRVRVQLSQPWPALNTGVMAWSKNSKPFCDEWRRVTNMRNAFIVDETAAQIIYPEFEHRVMSDMFNASVIYAPTGETVLGRRGVRVYHGHGGKFWKRPDGRKIFLPYYKRFLQENRGGLSYIQPHPKWWNQLDGRVRCDLARFMDVNALPNFKAI